MSTIYDKLSTSELDAEIAELSRATLKLLGDDFDTLPTDQQEDRIKKAEGNDRRMRLAIETRAKRRLAAKHATAKPMQVPPAVAAQLGLAAPEPAPVRFRAQTPAPVMYGQGARVSYGFEEPGIAASRFVKVFLASRGNLAMCDSLARQMYGSDPRINFEAALMTSPATAGGFAVPEQFSSEIIEVLRHMTVVRQFATTVEFRGTLVIPAVEQGIAAQYLGEMVDDNAQDLVFGQRRLTSRKLRALVVVSNDLVRSSSPAADLIVRNDLAAGLAEAEDAALLRSPGTGNAPKGLRYWAPVEQVVGSTGATAVLIEADLVQMVARFVASLRGRQTAPRWIVPSRSFYKLFNLRHLVGADPAGNLVFPELRGAEPRLLGIPVSVSDQIPVTLGGGTETEIFLVDFGQVVVGDEMTLVVDMSTEAAYRDSSGNLQAAFSQDASVLRAISTHDMVVRRTQGVHVLDGVTW